jgi:O-antigen ligase
LSILTAALLWPLAYFVVGRGRFVPDRLAFGAVPALVLFVVVGDLSAFGSPVIYRSIGYLILTVAGMWLAWQFNSTLTAIQYETGLKTFVVVMTVLVTAFAAYDFVPGVRLGNGKEILNPNTLALVTMSVLLSAMAIRFVPVRLLVMAPLASVIYLTGSRAAAAAAVVGLAVIVVVRLRVTRGRTILFGLLCVTLAMVIGIASVGSIEKGFNEFFAWNDPHRGLESGMSGRLLAWQATWDLFADHPILGVGFRAHEHILQVGSSSHNGYLAMLSEVGVIGFACVLYLIVSGIRSLWRRVRDRAATFSYSILFGLCCGYLLLALFERYLINIGNPTSLLFLLGIMMPVTITERDAPEWALSLDELDVRHTMEEPALG